MNWQNEGYVAVRARFHVLTGKKILWMLPESSMKEDLKVWQHTKIKTQGTWYVSFCYMDWTGKKKQKRKKGFKTKKEALNYEKEFIRKTAKRT